MSSPFSQPTSNTNPRTNPFFSNVGVGSPMQVPHTPTGTVPPPNPFADSFVFESTTGFEQPSKKRKRVDIQPISVPPRGENGFFASRPPLTPTSPMVSTTPICPFPISPMPGSHTPTNPFGLSSFHNDIESLINMNSPLDSLGPLTGSEAQAFADILSAPETHPGDFLPSFQFLQEELEGGTSVSVVKHLIRLQKVSEQSASQLEHLRFEQHQLVIPVPENQFDKLNGDYISINQELSGMLEQLQNIMCSTVLSPTHLNQLLSVKKEIEFTFTRLHLYANELMYIVSHPEDKERPCFATLVIKKQPFPKSIKQNIRSTSGVEDAIIIELINAPKSNCKPVDKVKAQLILEEKAPAGKKSKRNSLAMQNDQQTMSSNGVVRFPDLRFLHGTRLRIASLKFSVEVQYLKPGGILCNTLIESNLSNPFIVMTNENQWESSACNLLKHYVFENKNVSEVPWQKFANYLQHHYLRATRQDVTNPDRPLSIYDLDYIHHNRFNGAATVSVQSLDKFWDWFGKVMHAIRHQKPFLYLWLNGLVYGFITKEDAERLLQGQPVGTFVARFSERRPGQVAIAFSKQDATSQRISIIHYLFDFKAQSKSLPDFIKEKNNFIFLPKLKTEYISEGGNIARIVHKDEAFGEYYTTPPVDVVQGYAPEV